MDYEDYSDSDFEAELSAYVKDHQKQQEKDEAEKHKRLGEMVGGFMGLWWYLRSFRSSAIRNIKTYSAVADREAKLDAWERLDNPKVTLINEFGACKKCIPYLGQEYTLEEARAIIPIHYNCRCTFVLVEEPALAVGMIAGALQEQEDEANRNKDDEDHVTAELNAEIEAWLDKYDIISDIPQKVIEAQNKHIPESSDFIPGRSYLLPDMYKKVPGTKNKFDYTPIETLYNKYKWNADWAEFGNGNVRAIVTSDRYIGYVVFKDGSKMLTNKFTVHYSRKKGGYHIVPTLK